MIFLRKYKLEAALLLALIFMVFGSWMAEFQKAAETAQEEILRLHILAASDSEEDQQLKLAVRDRLMREASQWFSTEESKDLLEIKLQEQLKKISDTAEDELRLQGCDAAVTVELCHSNFSTRVYEDFTLPAGEYDALRIIIGEGEGKNWWCVLFPSLCLTASGSTEWFVENDLEILQTSPQLEPRFALYEWVQRLKNS